MESQSVIDGHATPAFSDSQGADDTAVAITIAADADNFWVLQKIIWSYDGDPTGGSITVTIGGTTVDYFDITSGGPGFMDYSIAGNGMTGLYNTSRTKNEALVVTLAAGGGTVEGSLTIRYL